MQKILSKQQIELLKFHKIEFEQFTEKPKKEYPRIRRQFKRYGMTSKVTWDADKSILLLAWLNIKESKHYPLADNITDTINNYYTLRDDNFVIAEKQKQETISNFYTQLSELKDFQFLSWFFCHADSILKIYKYDASKVVDLKFHQFKINTPNFKLKGSQEFALNWLLERIQIIIKYNYRPEDVRKFFLVWAEVHPMFWW